jgi:hypothetical protein
MKRLLLVLVLLWPAAALSGFYTGNDIQERCVGTRHGEPNANVSMFNSCIAYLAGIEDAAKTLKGWGYTNHGAPTGSCIPNGVTAGQLRQAWLNHTSQRPEGLRLDAASLVLNAFEKAWPCKR